MTGAHDLPGRDCDKAALPEGADPEIARPIAPPTAAPVADAARIQCLDVLRGVALMGVLLMNMQSFAMPISAYMNPTSFGDHTGLNYLLWSVNHVLADGKFITIFSMMFGGGIVLMTARAEARTGRSAAIHYRRMAWMVLFGALHGLLLWFGDILLAYALCGMIAYLFRRCRPWLLVTVGVVLILLPALFLSQFCAFIEFAPEADRQEMVDMWSPSPEDMEADLAAYRGSYTDHLRERASVWAGMLGFILIFCWRILGLMLVGMALFRTGVVTGSRSRSFYLALLVLGFGGGIPLSTYGLHLFEACDWDMVECMGQRGLYNYFGSLLSAFGWIGVVMLFCHAEAGAGVRSRVAAVGQMAFTNYIMHSVICTIVFYGHGFGLYGKLDRVEQLGVVLIVAAFQLTVSPAWMKRYRFGPLEWLWRSLSYWRRQPWHRAAGAKPA